MWIKILQGTRAGELRNVSASNAREMIRLKIAEAAKAPGIAPIETAEKQAEPETTEERRPTPRFRIDHEYPRAKAAAKARAERAPKPTKAKPRKSKK